MPPLADDALLPFVLAFGALLLGWYVVGNEVMRRRAAALALWSKRVVDPMGGRQAVRWLTPQSFRLEVDDPRPPYRRASITGLTESLDVPIVWLWNRRRGRRDMVLLQLSLRDQPRWGLELFRPLSLLAGDARHSAGQEGWSEQPLGELRLASPGGPAADLAGRLLALLGEQRQHLVRLSVRRRETHLALALNVPDHARLSPERCFELVERLGAEILRTS
jgi:hypothetical protein